MVRVLVVFRTRPEAIKFSPVIKELNKYTDKFIPSVCITAKHRQMIDPLLRLFSIEPTYDLNIMVENQSFEDITISILQQLGEII